MYILCYLPVYPSVCLSRWGLTWSGTRSPIQFARLATALGTGFLAVVPVTVVLAAISLLMTTKNDDYDDYPDIPYNIVLCQVDTQIGNCARLSRYIG